MNFRTLKMTEKPDPHGQRPNVEPDAAALRAAFQTDLRTVLLRAAVRLLAEEGLGALTLRRVAERVNASTKVVYTYFGGKDGLLDALYLHAFAVLTEAFRGEAGEPDPGRRLVRMAAAYRRLAMAEPALYSLMFGDLGRAYEAPLDSRRQAWASFEALRDSVALGLPQVAREETSHVAHLVWAAMHGAVALEVRGLLGRPEDGERLFKDAVRAVCKAHGLACASPDPF